MDFQILGSFEVLDDGAVVRIPAGRERALLALLVVNRGRVVSADAIVHALWGESPPGTAAKAVQGYVSHLRRLLPEGAIVTRPPGYVLEVADDDVDAARSERLATDGRHRLDEGDDVAAADALQEALALWRGPALADFAYDEFAQDEIRRLEELRLGAHEDRAEALLRVGRTGRPGRGARRARGGAPAARAPARPGDARHVPRGTPGRRARAVRRRPPRARRRARRQPGSRARADPSRHPHPGPRPRRARPRRAVGPGRAGARPAVAPRAPPSRDAPHRCRRRPGGDRRARPGADPRVRAESR